jgi:hypothetical protein
MARVGVPETGAATMVVSVMIRTPSRDSHSREPARCLVSELTTIRRDVKFRRRGAIDLVFLEYAAEPSGSSR